MIPTGLLEQTAGRFARMETRSRTRKFVLGLLADLPPRSGGESYGCEVTRGSRPGYSSDHFNRARILGTDWSHSTVRAMPSVAVTPLPKPKSRRAQSIG